LDLELRAAGIHRRKVVTFDESKYGISVAVACRRKESRCPSNSFGKAGLEISRSLPTRRATRSCTDGCGVYQGAISSLKEPREVTSDRVGVETSISCDVSLCLRNGVVKIQSRSIQEGRETGSGKQSGGADIRTQQIQLYVGPKNRAR
jgi:hypothetical protein